MILEGIAAFFVAASWDIARRWIQDRKQARELGHQQLTDLGKQFEDYALKVAKDLEGTVMHLRERQEVLDKAQANFLLELRNLVGQMVGKNNGLLEEKVKTGWGKSGR